MMNSTAKRIANDRANAKIATEHRCELVNDGLFPAKFTMPINLQLELTSKCNCNCKHCYNRSGKSNGKDAMTTDNWIKFCEHLVECGGVFQTTISGGEPLLLGNDLWRIMNVLHDDGTIFNLITNGYLFTKDTLKHLLKYRFFWVQVSVDSYDAKWHDEFRGLQGVWEKAVRACYAIACAGIPLRIASTITPRDIGNVEKFITMAIELGASYLIVGEVIPSGRAFDNEDILLTNDSRNAFYEEIDSLIKRYKNKISILVSGSQRVQLEYSSVSAVDGAIIRPDGNIRLDCGCPFVIGNVLKDDIVQVWREKSNCWQNPIVQRYIQSCDEFSGKSSFVKNYVDEDIFI